MAQAQGCQATSWAALLLDLDGTLLDTEAPCQAALDFALRAHAIRPSPALRAALVGLSTRDRVSLLHAECGAGIDPDSFIASYYRRRDALLRNNLRRKPGATVLLASIEASALPWGIVTSAGRDTALARLRAAAFSPVVLVTRDDVVRGKPHPAGYALAAARLGVQPSRCLAIEDSSHGVRAARDAGMAVAMVPDLLPPGPEELASCLAILPDLASAIGLLTATVEPAHRYPARPVDQDGGIRGGS